MSAASAVIPTLGRSSRSVARKGDQVLLELDLAARLTAAHPRVDAVRGCVAIERGPLVYALEKVEPAQRARLLAR